MKTSRTLSNKTQIFSLLLVIFTGIFFALSVAALMINHYETSKTYQLKNVLLSPESTETLLSKFVISTPFDYSEWNPFTKTWKQFEVNLPAYTKFYSLVLEDTSIEPVSEDDLEPFNRTNPSTLTLFFQNKSEPDLKVKEFQRVQFIKNGDYYRVELHMEAADGRSNWVYFYHPSIEKNVESLFTGKSS